MEVVRLVRRSRLAIRTSTFAQRAKIQAALEDAGYDPWLDDSDVQVGVLLHEELRAFSARWW
jgi:hypothetical protein